MLLDDLEAVAAAPELNEKASRDLSPRCYLSCWRRLDGRSPSAADQLKPWTAGRRLARGAVAGEARPLRGRHGCVRPRRRGQGDGGPGGEVPGIARAAPGPLRGGGCTQRAGARKPLPRAMPSCSFSLGRLTERHRAARSRSAKSFWASTTARSCSGTLIERAEEQAYAGFGAEGRGLLREDDAARGGAEYLVHAGRLRVRLRPAVGPARARASASAWWKVISSAGLPRPAAVPRAAGRRWESPGPRWSCSVTQEVPSVIAMRSGTPSTRPGSTCQPCRSTGRDQVECQAGDDAVDRVQGERMAVVVDQHRQPDVRCPAGPARAGSVPGTPRSGGGRRRSGPRGRPVPAAIAASPRGRRSARSGGVRRSRCPRPATVHPRGRRPRRHWPRRHRRTRAGSARGRRRWPPSVRTGRRPSAASRPRAAAPPAGPDRGRASRPARRARRCRTCCS